MWLFQVWSVYVIPSKHSTQPVVSPSSGMQCSSHSLLWWFCYYDSKSDGDGKKAKSSLKHLIRICHHYNMQQSAIPKCSLRESEAVFSCLYIKTGKLCTGIRTHECHDKEFINLNVRSRKNSLWKRKSVWTQIDLHKPQYQALTSFYTGRTWFFSRHYPSRLNASVPCLEVELEPEWAWLWEKHVNDFTASVEILSARGGWRSLIHAAARSRTTPSPGWGQLRLCPIVCEHPPGAGVSCAL